MQLLHALLGSALAVPVLILGAAPADDPSLTAAGSPYGAHHFLAHRDGPRTPVLADDAVVRFGLARLEDPVGTTPEIPVWNSTSASDCSVRRETDPNCSAHESTGANCSVKGSGGKCSILAPRDPYKNYHGCSALTTSGVNCSVIQTGGGIGNTAKCSTFAGSGADLGTRCSTHSGGTALPQCSTIAGTSNQGQCSVHGSSSNERCSTFSANSRCSVQAGTGGSCTAFGGQYPQQCSAHAGGACSTFTTGGGATPPNGRTCSG